MNVINCIVIETFEFLFFYKKLDNLLANFRMQLHQNSLAVSTRYECPFAMYSRYMLFFLEK